MLFFTVELMEHIAEYTNTYGWSAVLHKPTYANKHGEWVNTTADELYKLIALILYFGLVDVSTTHRYWSKKSLYHGLWARSIMARDRYKALMAMLHIVDPNAETESEKLAKVNGFMKHIKDRCMALYQPFQQVAVDERMVKSKHRSGIRQFIKNKPVKWGIKLWVLADSANGYTYDFNVYIGKRAGHLASDNGLAYDTVMDLAAPLLHQGYHFYFDNFYSSVKLLKDLFASGTPSTGTACENRRHFPESMKNGKKWAKSQDRGGMRWVRDEVCLALQWKDNRAVTLLSTINHANEFVMAERRERIGYRWRTLQVQQPKAIHDYNHFMNGVDRSDQLMTNNNVLRKTMKWWKTLFFHMVDIAVVNSYILFQLHRSEHPDDALLNRPKKYALAEYREELVRQLAGLDEYGQPPVYKPPKREPGPFQSVHLPAFSDKKRNCKVCYATTKRELKVFSFCNAPQCQVYLHCTAEKNCFAIWHSREYHSES